MYMFMMVSGFTFYMTSIIRRERRDTQKLMFGKPG